MYISNELQDSVDEIGRIISYGNKAGWDVEEPIDIWVKRYSNKNAGV